jgi:hypothetical protein
VLNLSEIEEMRKSNKRQSREEEKERGKVENKGNIQD